MEIDLHNVIKSAYRPFSIPQIKTIMVQILESLHIVHSHGLMHRDIKPSNFLFSSQNELKLCDFGLCRIDSKISSDKEVE